jgi:competence protein ComEC
MDRKFINILTLVIFAFLLGIIDLFASTAGDRANLAHVYILDVGQGDSFLIESGNGHQILIDGGRDTKVLTELQKVMSVWDKKIDVIVATHPDADHIGGLASVIDRYDVDLFLTSDVQTDTKTFSNLFQKISDKKIPAYYVRYGMNISLDKNLPTNFKILFPDRPTTNWETNSASIVGRLQIGDRSALFTGDSPISIEKFLVKAMPHDIDVDILKLGHHGSKTSSSSEFLRATSPDLAIISAGVNNRYGHPHQIVLDNLEKLGIPYLSTQNESTITFETDGNKWFKK